MLDLAVSPLFVWDVFTPTLRHETAAGQAQLATVFSVGLLVFMVGVIVGGRLADSVPPRSLALISAAGCSAGLLGSAAASSVGALIGTFGVLLGGATGLGYATAVRVAGTVGSGRGLALSLVVSAYAVGTAVLAPVTAVSLRAVGRSWTLVLLAVSVAGILSVAAVLVPGRTADTRPARHRRASGGTPVRVHPRGPLVALWVAFGLGSAPALAAFAQAGSLAGAPSTGTLALMLLNVGNFVGRLLAGPLSDRVGRIAALHANSVLLILACLPLAIGTTGFLALTALLLLGTQYGALSTLAPAATSDAVPGHQFGTMYGLVFTGWGVAGLLAPVTSAELASRVGFTGVFQGFLVVAAVAWAGVATHARLVHRQSHGDPSDRETDTT
nr:MFS transporter [Pseudonocardia sp. C8]